MAALKKKGAVPVAQAVPADPALWAEKCQDLVAAWFRKEYTDKHYACWSCRVPCVFSAADQKYSYEVKKNHIDQSRNLCETCWKDSLRVDAATEVYAARWAESKNTLRTDGAFLSGWLDLLLQHDKYTHKKNTATQAMLRKLLLRINDIPS